MSVQSPGRVASEGSDASALHHDCLYTEGWLVVGRSEWCEREREWGGGGVGRVVVARNVNEREGVRRATARWGFYRFPSPGGPQGRMEELARDGMGGGG